MLNILSTLGAASLFGVAVNVLCSFTPETVTQMLGSL